MKNLAFPCLMGILTVAILFAQEAGNKAPQNPAAADHLAQAGPASPEDLQQLKTDLQRLQVLVNQMRTNLAFVQTSQTPLKHQFELEADAWQVTVEQMDRRVKRMEERGTPR